MFINIPRRRLANGVKMNQKRCDVGQVVNDSCSLDAMPAIVGFHVTVIVQVLVRDDSREACSAKRVGTLLDSLVEAETPTASMRLADPGSTGSAGHCPFPRPKYRANPYIRLKRPAHILDRRPRY
jgi:hypothetical protein